MAQAVLRELSAILLGELKDPRLRGVTFTRVTMSADLRHGKVFFSHLEGPERGAQAIAGFKSASSYIRRQIAGALRLRYAPDFTFEFDSAGERAARIDALLRASRPKDSAPDES